MYEFCDFCLFCIAECCHLLCAICVAWSGHCVITLCVGYDVKVKVAAGGDGEAVKTADAGGSSPESTELNPPITQMRGDGDERRVEGAECTPHTWSSNPPRSPRWEVTGTRGAWRARSARSTRDRLTPPDHLDEGWRGRDAWRARSAHPTRDRLTVPITQMRGDGDDRRVEGAECTPHTWSSNPPDHPDERWRGRDAWRARSAHPTRDRLTPPITQMRGDGDDRRVEGAECTPHTWSSNPPRSPRWGVTGTRRVEGAECTPHTWSSNPPDHPDEGGRGR